jgi:hypothetical protein
MGRLADLADIYFINYKRLLTPSRHPEGSPHRGGDARRAEGVYYD